MYYSLSQAQAAICDLVAQYNQVHHGDPVAVYPELLLVPLADCKLHRLELINIPHSIREDALVTILYIDHVIFIKFFYYFYFVLIFI